MAHTQHYGTASKWGAVPPWYEHLMLSRWLGVSPWDAVGLPPLPIFRIWASKALECEAGAKQAIKTFNEQTPSQARPEPEAAPADSTDSTVIPWRR